MTNYHHCSMYECTDAEKIGVGTGETNGEDRICVSLGGPWYSLSRDAARELYILLDHMRDRFLPEE